MSSNTPSILQAIIKREVSGKFMKKYNKEKARDNFSQNNPKWNKRKSRKPCKPVTPEMIKQIVKLYPNHYQSEIAIKMVLPAHDITFIIKQLKKEKVLPDKVEHTRKDEIKEAITKYKQNNL